MALQAGRPPLDLWRQCPGLREVVAAHLGEVEDLEVIPLDAHGRPAHDTGQTVYSYDVRMTLRVPRHEVPPCEPGST